MDGLAEFEECGRLWVRGAVPAADLDQLATAIPSDGRPGIRPDTGLPAFRYFSGHDPVGALARRLGLSPHPVRFVAFQKDETANWSVPWHQDRVVAVADRHESPGWSAWLPKGAYWHAEPPEALLERMIFIRLHIDAADETNGCLQLALGSHREGRVPADAASDIAARYPVEHCRAAPGDLLAVKALTLHRSAPSVSGAPRRALRIDYADRAMLPAPMSWALQPAAMSG
ncbi:MAG: phytanoyl-CoA dioxygenase family protein [Hyphomonas sp.]|nr:phytanoyl-CoA dioxygenase family protein [Hyphomonas sp.]